MSRLLLRGLIIPRSLCLLESTTSKSRLLSSRVALSSADHRHQTNAGLPSLLGSSINRRYSDHAKSDGDKGVTEIDASAVGGAKDSGLTEAAIGEVKIETEEKIASEKERHEGDAWSAEGVRDSELTSEAIHVRVKHVEDTLADGPASDGLRIEAEAKVAAENVKEVEDTMAVGAASEAVATDQIIEVKIEAEEKAATENVKDIKETQAAEVVGESVVTDKVIEVKIEADAVGIEAVEKVATKNVKDVEDALAVGAAGEPALADKRIDEVKIEAGEKAAIENVKDVEDTQAAEVVGDSAVTDKIVEIKIEADEVRIEAAGKVATEKVKDVEDTLVVGAASEPALTAKMIDEVTTEAEEKVAAENVKDVEVTQAAEMVRESVANEMRIEAAENVATENVKDVEDTLVVGAASEPALIVKTIDEVRIEAVEEATTEKKMDVEDTPTVAAASEPAVTDEIIREVRIEADEKVATEKVTDLEDIRAVAAASESALTGESEKKNVTEEPKDAEDTLAVGAASESEKAIIGNAEIHIEEKFSAKEKTEDTNLSVESSSKSIGEDGFLTTLGGKKKKKKKKAAVTSTATPEFFLLADDADTGMAVDEVPTASTEQGAADEKSVGGEEDKGEKKKKKKKKKKEKSAAASEAATSEPEPAVDDASNEIRLTSEEVPSLADDADIVEAAKEVARGAGPEDAQVVENDLLQFLRSARVKESSPEPVAAEATATDETAAAVDETAPVAAPSFNFLMEMMLDQEKGAGRRRSDWNKPTRDPPLKKGKVEYPQNIPIRKTRPSTEGDAVRVSLGDPLEGLPLDRPPARRPPKLRGEDRRRVGQSESDLIQVGRGDPIEAMEAVRPQRLRQSPPPQSERDRIQVGRGDPIEAIGAVRPRRLRQSPPPQSGRRGVRDQDFVEVGRGDPMEAVDAVELANVEPKRRDFDDRRDGETESVRLISDEDFESNKRRRDEDGRRRSRRSEEEAYEPLKYARDGQRKSGLSIFVNAALPDPETTAELRQGLGPDFRWREPSIYDLLRDGANKRAAVALPSNGFQEMAKWTDEGKLWKFPIDNEQDIGPEAHVPFTDHVFLDRLTRDFPKAGPARNFIDLVVIGLSRNPDMSVEEKRRYVVWYGDYFHEKGLMGETGL